MFFINENFNIKEFLAFISKINLLYRMNDYFSIKKYIIDTINEFDNNSQNFTKEQFNFTKEQDLFFNNTLVMFKSRKTNPKKTLNSEYFDKLLIVKNLNPILYKTMEIKLIEYFDKYNNKKCEDDESIDLKNEDLISLNNLMFRNIISLPKNYNNFFLVVVDSIYKELYKLQKDQQNLLNYPELLSNLYYKLKLLRIVVDYELDLWKSLDFYLQENPPNNKLNTIMAIPVSKIKILEIDFKNDIYKNVNKLCLKEIFELIPLPKFEKYKSKIGNIINNKELNDTDDFVYKKYFMHNRLKDLLFSAKMILFQDYHYNINYFIEDYYVSFIKNYYRFFNCLKK